MNKPLLLTDFFDRAVHLYGEKKAIIDQHDNTYTYNEMSQRVNQLSHGLHSLGVQKQEHIAYLAPNTIEMYEGFYGIFQVGGVMVSLNTRLSPNEYLFILNHSESKVLFVDGELLHQIEPIIDQLETVEKIIVHGATEDKGDLLAYSSWLAVQSTEAFERPKLSEDAVATLLYTSGTTGNPKGVMLTHRNNYLHAITTGHHLRVNDKDTLIHILPMFHVNGWGSPFYYTANGATQIMQKDNNPSQILQRMEKYGVTVMHMAPVVLGGLIDEFPNTKPTLAQDVRIVIAGSAPPQAFIKKVEEDIGWEFFQVYGMTETAPLSLASYVSSEDLDVTGDDYYQMKAKAGYEMIGTSVRVVDENGEDVKNDGTEVGEVIVRGHGVMKGYWKNEEETNRTIINGWLYTGDVGTIDARNRVAIVDRKKDIIISGGENIASIEVEGVYHEHSAVREVAIVAVPHEKWGESPHACIVLREGMTATEEELIAFARERISHFKCPKGITFLDELPKNASGKILKVRLRELV